MTDQTGIQTKWVALDSIQLWERNYNQGDVGAIITSIKRFGFNNALRVWQDTVMAGNHSAMALRQLKQAGWEAFGGAIQVKDDSWQVQAVDVSHLERQEAEAFAIADNHTAELATHDDVALAQLLQEFANDDMDLLMATGFDGDDLDALLRELALPDGFQEYDESIEDEVEYHDCPNCGHKFPK